MPTPSVSNSPSPSPPPPTLQSSFEATKSGVVRLEVSLCSDAAIGSGFELGPQLVATAAHVVQDGQVIRVVQGTTSTAGTVIGIDPGADVALVKTVALLSGHAFRFADRNPAVGDLVAAIGYPEGDPLSFNTGTVNGLGRKAVIEGTARHDLLEMDAATTHGSSGGPVIRADGEVVGLVDAGPDGEAGRRLAVSGATASPLLAAWSAAPLFNEPGQCSGGVDLDGEPVPPDQLPTGLGRQVLATLDVYFRGINGGDFPTALAQTAEPVALSTFTQAVTSSQDSGFQVKDVQDRGDGNVVVWLTFTSRQDAGKGPAARPQETCTDWSLDYDLVQKNGLWLIAGTSPHGTANALCADPQATADPGTGD